MLRKERHMTYGSRKAKVATVAMVKSGCLNDKNSPIAEAQTNSNSQKIQPLFIHQWIQRLRVPSQTAFTVSLSGFSWISALVDRCSKEIHEYHATSRPKPSQNMCVSPFFTLRLSPKQQSSPKDPVKREDSALDRMDMGPEGLGPWGPVWGAKIWGFHGEACIS